MNFILLIGIIFAILDIIYIFSYIEKFENFIFILINNIKENTVYSIKNFLIKKLSFILLNKNVINT